MLEFNASACVAADHPCLAGHFPGAPVVPAVLLLELAAETLAQRLNGFRLEGVPAAKFIAPVPPGQALSLHFKLEMRTGRAAFRCEAAGRLAAQGELVFSV